MGTVQIRYQKNFKNAFAMKCYCNMLRIPWIVHRTNSSLSNECHLPMNWLYNVVRCQQLKYFGHVTRHNDLEKTIMQGMVAEKRSRGKPRQRWEKDIRDIFSTMATASKLAEDKHRFCKDFVKQRPEEDILSEEVKKSILDDVFERMTL